MGQSLKEFPLLFFLISCSIILFGVAPMSERAPLPHPVADQPGPDRISAASETGDIGLLLLDSRVFPARQIGVWPHPDGLHLQPPPARLRRRCGKGGARARARPHRDALSLRLAKARLEWVFVDRDGPGGGLLSGHGGVLLLGRRRRALPGSEINPCFVSTRLRIKRLAFLKPSGVLTSEGFPLNQSWTEGPVCRLPR